MPGGHTTLALVDVYDDSYCTVRTACFGLGVGSIPPLSPHPRARRSLVFPAPVCRHVLRDHENEQHSHRRTTPHPSTVGEPDVFSIENTAIQVLEMLGTAVVGPKD